MRFWLGVLALIAACAGYLAWTHYFNKPVVFDRRHLAADGIFYTLRYFSLPTKYGVTGVPPGTQVIRTKDLGDKLQVKVGETEVEILRQELTNDLDIASRVALTDALRQRDAEEAASRARSSEHTFSDNLATGGSVQIFSATYGVADVAWDITERVRQELLSGRTSIRASNDLAGGDPMFGQIKTMYISYSIGSGAQSVVLREGESIDFPPRPRPRVRQPLGAPTKLDRGAYDHKDNVARPPVLPPVIYTRPKP